MDALERSGVADRTLLVVTSDHGALPGDRVLGADGEVLRDADGEEAYRTYGHDPSGGWRGSKAHAWEGGHRVPLVVRPPGPPRGAVVDDRLVSLVDLLPTVADLTGTPLPAGAAPDGVAFAVGARSACAGAPAARARGAPLRGGRCSGCARGPGS